MTLAVLAALAAPQIISPDGAWCWFADPRAIATRDSAYVGWINRAGDVQVGDLNGQIITLHEKFEVDDHDNPALHELPDGRVIAFYTKHTGREIYSRTTTRAGDISAWSRENIFRPQPDGSSYTYPNPSYLSGEKRLYMTWRGIEWKPTLSWSNDNGETWAPAVKMFSAPGAGPGNRPYLKSATDGRKRIHFAITDGHPRNEPTNSIYHCYMEGGLFYRANGDVIGSLETLPINPAKMDLVYDARTTGHRAWIWDIALDKTGFPQIVYSRLPSEDNHIYHNARWTGLGWSDNKVADAGGWFPETPEGQKEREPHYSGGIVLDHNDPRYVYFSRPNGAHFEIEEGFSEDGKSWRFRPITQGSSANQVRPFVLRGRGEPWLFWMSNDGGYVHYTNYRSSIRGAPLKRFAP